MTPEQRAENIVNPDNDLYAAIVRAIKEASESASTAGAEDMRERAASVKLDGCAGNPKQFMDGYMLAEFEMRKAIRSLTPTSNVLAVAEARGTVRLSLEDIIIALNYASEGRENWKGIKPDLLGNEINRILAKRLEEKE